jgi:hypothetical protein
VLGDLQPGALAVARADRFENFAVRELLATRNQCSIFLRSNPNLVAIYARHCGGCGHIEALN